MDVHAEASSEGLVFDPEGNPDFAQVVDKMPNNVVQPIPIRATFLSDCEGLFHADGDC